MYRAIAWFLNPLKHCWSRLKALIISYFRSAYYQVIIVGWAIPFNYGEKVFDWKSTHSNRCMNANQLKSALWLYYSSIWISLRAIDGNFRVSIGKMLIVFLFLVRNYYKSRIHLPVITHFKYEIFRDFLKLVNWDCRIIIFTRFNVKSI